MSQAGKINDTVSPGSGAVLFLEGNTGGNVPPDGSGVIHVVSNEGFSVDGNAGTNTLTINPPAVGSSGNVLTSDGSIWISSPPAIVQTSGTWTPVLSFGGGSTGITYGTQLGYYVQIGNIVYIYFNITLTNKGSSTGNAAIGGLPVAVGTNFASCLVVYSTFTGTASFGLGVTASSTSLNPLALPSLIIHTDAAYTNTSRVSGSFFYSIL